MPTINAPKGHGNDHHFIADGPTGRREPDLNYAYEPHGLVAGAEEAEQAAQAAQHLSMQLEAKDTELATANAKIAELTAQLASKAPKGAKAD